MKQKQSKYKKQITIIVSIVVAVLLLICGVYTYYVKQERDIENQAKHNVALYVVHTYPGVKEIEMTEFSKPNALGEGGYATTIRINKDDNKVLTVVLDNLQDSPDTMEWRFSRPALVRTIKKDKSRTLKNVTVKEWDGE